MTSTATALAHPNIAFIKYWGNKDENLRLPSNGSLSMNLANLDTRTRVTFDPELEADTLTLNQIPQEGPGLARVSAFLTRVRSLSDVPHFAAVHSSNNFPMGAGIASSASAFAALSLAASVAAGLSLEEPALSRLARTGSGSACRSIPTGFVEWQAATKDEDSYAFSIAAPEHWALVDTVAIINKEHKTTGSTQGHALASTSPLQQARIANTPKRLEKCHKAILKRAFGAFAEVVELDSNLMHAVMMTSTPPLFYWHDTTLNVMRAVRRWRANGLPACYTIDAGPNVHVLSPQPYAQEIQTRLNQLPGVEDILTATPGNAAHIIQEEPHAV